MSTSYVNSKIESINSTQKAPNVFIDVSDGGGPVVKKSAPIVTKVVKPVTDVTYALSSSTPIVDNGETFDVILSTTNISDNTNVPYTIYNVTSKQINNASLTGNFTVQNSTDSFPITVTGKLYWASVVRDGVGIRVFSDTNGNVYSINSSQGLITLTKHNNNGTFIKEVKYFSSAYIEVYDASLDNTGNIIVTGLHSDNNTNDIFLMKIDTDGNLLWQSILGSTDDTIHTQGTSIYINSSNEILITYSSDNMGIIKIDIETGNILWNREITTGTTINVGIAGILSIKENSLGEIIVLCEGSLDSTPTAILSKLNTNGNIIWQKIFNNLGTNSIYPDDMCIDNDRNIYVLGDVVKYDNTTGQSTGSGVIFKLNTAGSIIWQKTVKPQNDNQISFSSICLDTDNNIYISGNNYRDGTQGLITKCNNNGDIIFARVLYAENDSTELHDIYTSSSDMYVTGQYGSEGSSVFIGKLSATGAGTGTYTTENFITGIIYENKEVTTQNAVFTTVESNLALQDGTISITPTEFSQDTIIEENYTIKMGTDLPNHIEIRLDNNEASVTVVISLKKYVLSSNLPTVVKGDLLRITLDTENVANGTHVPYTITGISSPEISGKPLKDEFIVSNNTAFKEFNMNPLPPLYWQEVQIPSDSRHYNLIDSVVDRAGNIIAVGEFRSTPMGEYDTIYILKYDKDGIVIDQCNLTTETGCRATAISLDSSENIIITGYVLSLTSIDEYKGIIIKLETNLSIIWSTIISTPPKSKILGLHVNSANSLFIVGNKWEDYSLTPQIFISKVSNNGAVIWTRSIGNSGPASQTGADICLDNAGYIYITGDYTTGTGTFPNRSYALVAKFDPLGAPIWQKIIDSTLDSTGNKILCANSLVYIVASNRTPDGYLKSLFAIFSPDGNLNYSITDGTDYIVSVPTSITHDSAGNIYTISRNSYFNGTILYKYSPNGTQLFSMMFYHLNSIERMNSIVWNHETNRLVISGQKDVIDYAAEGFMCYSVELPTNGAIDVPGPDFYIYDFSQTTYDDIVSVSDVNLPELPDVVSLGNHNTTRHPAVEVFDIVLIEGLYPSLLLTLDNNADSITVDTRAKDPMRLHVYMYDPSFIVTLPFTGTYDITVDWGDGTVDDFVSGQPVTHTYASKQGYPIVINGTATAYGIENHNNTNIIEMSAFGDLGISSFAWAFHNATNFSGISNYIPHTVTDISHMFDGATILYNGCSSWDTKNIQNMSYAFANATNFNGWIEEWNTSKVTNMSRMFYRARGFNQYIGNWVVSEVTDFSYMFDEAISFNQPLNSWNTAKAINFDGMFANSAFNQPLGLWNTSSCQSTRFMFTNTSFNHPINPWNTSKVTNMEGMFSDNPVFNQPLNSWDTSLVTNTSEMFRNAQSFNQPLNSWNMSRVTNMSNMFRLALSFNQPLGSWNTPLVTNMDYMFSEAYAFVQNISTWIIPGIPVYPVMFLYASPMDPKSGNSYDSYLPVGWGPYEPPNFA